MTLCGILLWELNSAVMAMVSKLRYDIQSVHVLHPYLTRSGRVGVGVEVGVFELHDHN